MDQLSNILAPYTTHVGVIAGIVTILQFFSGIPVCLDIKKNGSTQGFSVIPFLGGAVFGVLNLQFGMIINDNAMVKVNLVGLALNVIYLTFYYIFTTGKAKTVVWAQTGFAGAFTVASLAYAQMEDAELVSFRFGIFLTILLLLLIGSPLLSLGEILKNKSTEGMPFPIIASGAVVSFMWLLYGFCINNEIIVIQNIIALFLTIVQLSLFVIYPAKSHSSERKSKKSVKKD